MNWICTLARRMARAGMVRVQLPHQIIADETIIASHTKRNAQERFNILEEIKNVR